MAGGFRGLQRGAVTAEADSAILREPSLAFPKHGAAMGFCKAHLGGEAAFN